MKTAAMDLELIKTEIAQKDGFDTWSQMVECFCTTEPGRRVINKNITDLVRRVVADPTGKRQSHLKIKQLEWEERKYCYVARTAFGFYRILDASTLEKKQSCALYFGETAQKVSIGTYEECIKDAQADFEARIKKCLIIE